VREHSSPFFSFFPLPLLPPLRNCLSARLYRDAQKGQVLGSRNVLPFDRMRAFLPSFFLPPSFCARGKAEKPDQAASATSSPPILLFFLFSLSPTLTKPGIGKMTSSRRWSFFLLKIVFLPPDVRSRPDPLCNFFFPPYVPLSLKRVQSYGSSCGCKLPSSILCLSFPFLTKGKGLERPCS